MDWQDNTLKNPDFKANLLNTFSNENWFNKESILKILNSNETKPQENKQNKNENSKLGARIPTLA